MIRKYLNGSEPTLSRANQIARQANCSLEWLATGHGFQYRQAEVVDMQALEEATGRTAPASLAVLRQKAERFSTVIDPAQIAEVALGCQA